MPRRPLLSPTDFVGAAIAMVDDQGLEALSLRSLGERLGVSHTAVYSHFRDKAELVSAMLDALIVEIGVGLDVTDLDPRDTVLAIARHARSVLASHPRLLGALSTSIGATPNGRELMVMLSTVLRDAGLAGEDLTLTYQALESYVIGTSLFDFAGGPDPAAARRVRYRVVGTEEFDAVSRSDDDVRSHTERAFERGLLALVDTLVPR